ncbi:16471_t:CDS:1, partial [Dentiscutata erythropus]
NLYKKVIAELLGPNNNNPINNIASSYNLLQSYQIQVEITNQFLHQSKRMENRKALLWYAYYLESILENMSSDKRPSCTKQLSRYYATVAVRTYYIFRKWRIARIDQTIKLTLPMIYELKAKDYQRIVN